MFKTVFFTIIGVLLLCAMNDVMDEIFTQHTFHLLPFLQLNMLYILFGILIQRKKVERILNQRFINPNHFILPSIVLLTLTMIPNPFWIAWFGPGHNIVSVFIIDPLVHFDTHSIIGVFSGALFIQSLTR